VLDSMGEPAEDTFHCDGSPAYGRSTCDHDALWREKQVCPRASMGDWSANSRPAMTACHARACREAPPDTITISTRTGRVPFATFKRNSAVWPSTLVLANIFRNTTFFYRALKT